MYISHTDWPLTTDSVRDVIFIAFRYIQFASHLFFVQDYISVRAAKLTVLFTVYSTDFLLILLFHEYIILATFIQSSGSIALQVKICQYKFLMYTYVQHTTYYCNYHSTVFCINTVFRRLDSVFVFRWNLLSYVLNKRQDDG
jgi:hypothetical protein